MIFLPSFLKKTSAIADIYIISLTAVLGKHLHVKQAEICVRLNPKQLTGLMDRYIS